jgi:hypothetical protein
MASGQITDADRLTITLVKPLDPPEAILIIWPPKPTVVAPVRLQATVVAIVKVLAAVQIEYAARRLSGRDAKD